MKRQRATPRLLQNNGVVNLHACSIVFSVTGTFRYSQLSKWKEAELSHWRNWFTVPGQNVFECNSEELHLFPPLLITY
jgi:hypothetical protein